MPGFSSEWLKPRFRACARSRYSTKSNCSTTRYRTRSRAQLSIGINHQTPHSVTPPLIRRVAYTRSAGLNRHIAGMQEHQEKQASKRHQPGLQSCGLHREVDFEAQPHDKWRARGRSAMIISQRGRFPALHPVPRIHERVLGGFDGPLSRTIGVLRHGRRPAGRCTSRRSGDTSFDR